MCHTVIKDDTFIASILLQNFRLNKLVVKHFSPNEKIQFLSNVSDSNDFNVVK